MGLLKGVTMSSKISYACDNCKKQKEQRLRDKPKGQWISLWSNERKWDCDFCGVACLKEWFGG